MDARIVQGFQVEVGAAAIEKSRSRNSRMGEGTEASTSVTDYSIIPCISRSSDQIDGQIHTQEEAQNDIAHWNIFLLGFDMVVDVAACQVGW